MTKVRDYSKLASDILKEIGGQDNLVSFSRCATRLRLVLKDIPENAVNNIKGLPGVITVIVNSGQFQVVIGTHVADVYGAMSEQVDQSLLQAEPKEKNASLILSLQRCRLCLRHLSIFWHQRVSYRVF